MGNSMQLVTLDFETFYDKQYSLSKLTTEEYINDYRFEAIGVATKINENETTWCSGDHSEIQNYLDAIDWDDSIMVAHNAMFDAAILSWRFGIKPKRIADTLSMSRAIDGVNAKHSLAAAASRHNLGQKGNEVIAALGKQRKDFDTEELERYGGYCINDVELCFRLFCLYAGQFSREELEIVSLTIKMFSEPVLELDLPLLEQHLRTIQDMKAELMVAANADSEILQSNPKFAERLKTLGVTPPTKTSIRTGKTAFAFAKSDEGLQELREHPNPAVQILVSARLGVKSTIEETRTERLLGIARRTGILPVPLRYYAAHTGRWGGSDKLNMQNLPTREGNTIKQAITAPEGHVIIDADSAQIEARVLAWLAGQTDLVEAFAAGQDVYKMMAATIYSKSTADISKAERFVGKSVVLGSGYGMGAKKFKAQLWGFGVEIELDEAQRIIDTYRTNYSDIPALWKDGQACLSAIVDDQTRTLGIQPQVVYLDRSAVDEGISFVLPNKMMLSYPVLERTKDYEYSYLSKNNVRTKIYGGKVIENVCQAIARCIISWQMLKIAKKYKVALTVHDSIVCVVEEAEQEKARSYIETIMKTPPEWATGLPLNCDIGIGRSYGAC
jgi:DNA polymerase I-like protein with 3'-5' exonuclease and polymerase domains